MKDPKIEEAYDKIAPDADTAARILRNVQDKAVDQPAAIRIVPRRKLLLIAAIIALIAVLSTAGYAAYQRWHLPEPESFNPTGKWGYLDEHGRTEYTTPSMPDNLMASSDPADSSPADPQEPISDEAFMLRALDILKNAGMKNIEPDSMTVVRQADLKWDREEAEVSFIHDGLTTSVKFDAMNGDLIGFYGFEYVLSEGTPCKSQAEADALATACYESLPVTQGFQIQHIEKYDSNFWCYDFCREVLPEIFSEYECVRVAINPEKGLLTFCTVFDVPLLDDHEPGEQPLSLEEAQAYALANEQFNHDKIIENEGWTLTDAKIKVCLPNWLYSSGYGVNNKYSRVTRICWLLSYEKDFELYHARRDVMVDLYTGEILGGEFYG